MKRTDAIHALRERFEKDNHSVEGWTLISPEEAAALGVFDDFEWKKTEIQSADPGTGMSGGMDDGWINFPIEEDECPIDPNTKIDARAVHGDYASTTAALVMWDQVFAYRIHKSDDDGWIEWGGGECPLNAGADHDVKLRYGAVLQDDDPESWDWEHYGSLADIIAYRPHHED